MTQFLTWHLADSLPQEVVDKWREELRSEPPDKRKRELYQRIERFLDAGYGSQLLRNPVAGGIVQATLLRGHRQMYELHAWSVMPTHVHAVLTPEERWPLGEILRRIKGRSSFEKGRKLVFDKPLWQIEYHDRWTRDEKHFENVVRYTEWNPVKAKLCTDPSLWPFSSANPKNWGDSQPH